MAPLLGLLLALTNQDPKGFIGLGIMGEPMARNLLAKGNKLTLWNRSTQATKRLVTEFGNDKVTLADSPKDVMRKSNIVYTMLSTPQVVHHVYNQPDGILDGVHQNTKIVDCATLAEQDMEQLANQVAERGGRFLAAPVSGSKGPAIAGQLIFITGGDEALFKEVEDDLAKMGKASVFIGSPGDAAKFKLAVNMVMGTMMTALGEGISFCEASNLDTSTFIDVLDQGAMANPMFKLKGPKILSADHATAFPLKHAYKDMKLAIEEAEKNSRSLPTSAAATAQYEKALSLGCGDDDFSKVTDVPRNLL